MAITYKARFDRITRAETAQQGDTEKLRVSGILRAMDMSEHRAAYRFNKGIGMLAVAKTLDNGWSYNRLAAAVVMHDGTIVAERHSVRGVGYEIPTNKPCGAYVSDCGAYILTTGSDIEPVGEFTPMQGDPFCVAHDFDRTVRDAINSYYSGVVEAPSDALAVVNTLLFNADHRFANPVIEELVGVALG